MTSRASSPRRLQSQNSVKKQENGMDSPLRPGRQPLRAIPEASSSRSSSASEHTETSSPSKPPTPRGKKRAAAVYRGSENVDGNIGSASNTPEKPREKRTTLTRVSKATAPWSSKLPITASLARALQDSLQQTDSANKSWDSDSVGGTPTTSYRTPLIPSTGAGKPGSIEQTSRTFKISGKPPLDSELSRTCFGSSNSSFLQSTPSRSVNRSLRYGATPGSAASVGSSRAPGNGAKASGSFQFNTGQQISAQQFDFEEDNTFWEDHNVQVILRTRPINASESALKGFSKCLRQENSHSITWIGQPETRFTFDHVAGEHITQENLFRVAGVPMVENCMAGYNSCMFCYGQTGSGKTHTMLGDIVDLEQRPSADRGITPRVFEYLFSKIQKEEESRTDEHLKYVCKCSFLEIFNEQITDLLEPSSTNLQVREGGKKGVYVENLSEVAVGSVQDVVRLLLLGAANRKVSATNMNRESSRSHSVFTCTIESKWELNSATNIRFGRLNLVDLAGSERQKTSGAEGERLKEAANINKSLSTLGLVIMILVDVANGKQRHVPYRDSKLTYLLQDSLGGNSKTTMIANISPSSCCALETLSTLKFAQRAKFIRNNAVVNEDASGDMNGLRQEIQELKEELDRIRRQDLPRTPSMHSAASVAQDSVRTGDNNLGMAVIAVDEQEHSRCSLDAWEFSKAFSGPRFSNKKLEAMEAVLAGALRREQEAELTQKRQSAEIEQLTRLVKQREDDSQCSKMLLRFREDKIRRLEALSAGSMSADVYLRQENDFLMNELRLIQEKADRNPELTRFAMENIRLLEQLRRFQDFYTGGEREAMADEISSLRDQLLEALDSKLSLTALTSPQREALAPELAASQREIELLRIETDNYRREVEDCRKNLSSILEANSRITKQLDESNAELREVKLKNQVHQVELQKLREQALDAEAIEWGHAQHLELISNLKIKLQQSEDRADREANLRFDLNEHLKASLGEAADLQADLQESRGALDAAEMLVCRLQSAESDLSVAQEMAILAQNAVRQIHLEMKEIAEDQRLSMKHTEDAVAAACMKELELREELKDAQSLIQKLSSTKDEPMCSSCSVASENEPERGILISKRTVGISQLEQDLKSLDLLFGSGCTHFNTRSRESAKEEIHNIAKLCDDTSTTQRKQSSYQKQGKDCILKLNFTLEESHTVEDRALLEVDPDETRKDLQDAESVVFDLKGDRDHYVLKGNNLNPVDLELVQAICCLQGEIMKLKPQGTSDHSREIDTKWSSTELVKELQGLVWVVQAVLEERNILAAQNEALLKENDIATKAREESDAATSKLLEHLNEGEHALTDAVHEMQGILDDCLSQPTALDKGRLQEQESINVQQLDMTAPTARKVTDKIGQAGGNDHSDGIMRNFAVCTIMLQWFSDTLTAEFSAKNSFRTQNDRAEKDLGNKDRLIKKKEEEITVLQRDWAELESKTVKTQEKLRASNSLMKELARSEEELKLQTVALAAENKRLTRCMACREMEFSSLQGQIEGLEKSLKESHEKERISTTTLGNVKESLKVLEKQWHVEREQMKDRIVAANRELSESQEINQIFYNALKELEGEIIATEKKCQGTFSELETKWCIARGEMSSHLTQISLDFVEVKSSAEKTYLDLAKARSLLSAADTAIQQLVDKSSELKDTNKQLLVKQEALQSELSCWEQYSVELQKSSCFVPSPCKDTNAIANSGVRPFYNYFETLKTEVEKVRRECERLRAEVLDKDTTLLSVQLELSATIASSKVGEIELACLVAERSDLRLQLTNISEALVNAQDGVRCRDVELKTFECELHKVMDVLARTEEKMDESSLEWRKQIEKLKAEMEDAKFCASEKSTEAILLRKQFEDGQATLKEAEILVNALVRANEIAKRDVLKWKSRGEKITLHSSEVLSMIDEEVSVTMDHVEKHLQDLSSDIHGMKTLLTGISSERAAGFDHEFKEFMKIQISEIESATDGAHMKLSKMNAKVTELEQTEQQSVMEVEALQVSLERTQDLLVGSQAALEDAMQNMGVLHKGHATTRDELQGALTSLAGKSAYISELTFERDHLSTRNQELERLCTETCEELRINVANSKEMEMEKLTLVEATEMLQVENNHLRGQVKQLEISLADAMRMKQVVEMEVISLRQQKDSNEDEIRKFEVDLAAAQDAVNAAAAKLLETEVTIHALISDLENSHNEVVCIQESLDEAVTEVNDLRLLTHELGEKEEHLMAQAETQRNLLESTSEKFVQSEAEFHEAVEILATMLESTSSELHAAETLKADLEKNNIKFSSLLASLQVTASQLGQERGFLSVRVSALEEDKKNLLVRLEFQSKQLCMQSLEASAASSAQELQLEILKTIIGSTSKEVQEKDHMIFVLQEKLEQSSARCLALNENKNVLVERMEIQSLELCKLSQEASAASTAHQTELEILKTIKENALWELQEKDHMIFVLREKLEQNSARCLALDENKKHLVELLEIQSLELCKQSEEASAASTAHQAELEILKTIMESASSELQGKDEMIMSLGEKLEQSNARCLALDENKKDLLECLEIQSLELCKQSQETSAAFTVHQAKLEILKTTMESELQEKDEMMMSLREKLEQISVRCLALNENKKDLVERLEIQSLELCKQSQEASAAFTVHQTELEILKTTMESASSELQGKDEMMMSLREKLEQSSARCLALDENKKDLLERLDIQSRELCKQSQEASAASTAHQAELEILKTIMESSAWELQEKDEMMMSLREKLDQSTARCLTLDENKKDLVERLEIQSLELCKQSEEASAASTAYQAELEILKTTMESELQEKDEMMMSLREKLEQISVRCLALDENKKDLLELLEIQSLEFCKQSEEANASSTAHLLELEILRTIIDSASNELLEKDHITSSLLDNLQESSAETLKLLNSLEVSVVASAQMEHERDEILATANNLETEKRLLRDEVNIKSRSCADLEMKILRLQTEVQESSSASWKLKLELEIMTAMLECAVQESREKDAMATDLENLLSQSQLQNAEMLQSSQEVVNHFSLFQSQLDDCFQQNKELERNKLVLTAEVYSLSQEIAHVKELRQASEKCLEEFRTSFAQLGKQKDEEVRLLSNEVEKLKSQEADMEADLWDLEQRCQDTEVQLDEKVSELMVLRGKLVATQEECKLQLELVYEALRECERRTEEMDIERRDLINEIEEGCSVVADLQEKLQIRESEMEEHFNRHSIEQEALESLENKKSELESIVKHLTAEVVANQQRATAAENMQVETRLEMEALERDLKQKDDLLQNLESDLNLLQESAFQDLRLNQDLDSLRVSTDVLQQELNMQKERRTRLEIEIGQVTEEIVQTRNQAGTWKAKAYELETELDKKRQTIESLEDELRMAEQNMANTLEEVTVDLKEVENERDRLQIEVLELTEQLEMTHTMVEERDAVVSELHQAGELSRTHAKEKEDEAKLLTRSVHELESTVYALENQLGLLKREAERQRLLREDIEMESQKLNNHIFVTQSALEESNTRNAEELKHAVSALQETERKVEDKESEISHFRRKLENLEIVSKDKDVQINDAIAQISDLLLAAEVQKADYQQRLKRMESQVERSEIVNWEVQSGCTIPNSIEVSTEIVSFDANPAQESFSRRDMTHVSCQSRISELEELASSRQKEVFTLHTRLAEAESMTHDVLRDLLGVKSEMTNVVSMLDHQHIKQLAETACRKNVEAEEMETELSSLRSQLNAYIEERESWVEEINLRQCEIVAARVAAENLRQKEQVLTDEIEKFRIENINHQEKISELEMEIRRLPSSQQSFYQQINHHAKIKEENQALKLANEELSKELRRTELLHAGMHDELVTYKSVELKCASPSFDEERLNLRHLLQEAENSRAEAAQKLSSLCSALMQTAGLSVSETVDVPGAMDALDLLENRLRTTELELSDSKYKIKFTGERKRRTDIRAKDSPLRSISNFTDLLQRASSGSPAPR